MRTPVSTYRLQITEDLDLRAAARLLPYLRELGADWVYLSPLLASEADSDHGYDVADHSRVDPARGGLSGLAALSTEAHRLGMGVLVDIVPNHVGIARPQDNAWWWHVLTHGPESPFAEAFDIDWAAGGGRLRIPVVGDDDLSGPGGPIRNLTLSAGELVYHDQRFPLAPGTADGGSGGEEPDVEAVHARQHYELVSWRDADARLNYRRFFAINTLAAIRVEDPTWFARSHAAIKQWFDEGLVDGLRVDHPDGLRDPGGYLDDLAELTGGSYVVVEKILALHERPPTGSAAGPWLEELPASWATAGTTGYDALALIDRLLTDAAGREPLDALETRLRGGAVDWERLTHDRKRTVADTILRSEVLRIGRELRVELPDAPGATEDAVAELLACFPVYRSYLPLGREHLGHAAERARELRPDLAAALDAVVPALADPTKAPALRFQQTSGMVMAKGVEDCAFYRYSRLTSLNEVGGEPSVFSVTAEEFHALMARRQEAWPHAMTTLSTHDTKRGEDVRARITALAEVPAVWEEAVTRLQRLAPLPDPGFASLLWQAVLGAWPASRERLHGYAEKAMREAGDHTTWTAPAVDYEAAVHAAVDAAFDDPAVVEVLEDLAARVADAGWSNALAAKLLALTVPGVPDVYQGSELWEQSLVDPDNRRPVDFEARQELLESLAEGARPRLSGGLEDPGTAKLLVTRAALQARRDRPELFTGYAAVPAEGPAADHVVAFDRGGAVTVATRLPLGLQARGGWGETTLRLPRGRWADAVSGRSPRPDDAGRVRLGDLLAEHPVALLLPQTEPERPTEGRTSRRRGRFDVWAPFPETMSLSIGDQVVPMHRGDDDWWRPAGPVPEGEVDYGYLVDGADDPVPDPRSRRQPDGVHGRSRSFDPDAYGWSDQAWTGRQLAGAVIYELHLGTFTPEGTLDAAIARLDHLRSIGVDLVELLPVNAFNGTDNWGYDGVLWHAVHEGYGGPAAYQRFVDAAHRAGLGVIQDVVYNHLGPSGNYLPLFGPYLKTEGSNTWGALVNLDGNGSAEVRRYILDNAVMWLDDYHVDGLRLDAVHALEDSSATHLLEELAIEVAALSAYRKRPMTLIAESDLNDASMVTPREGGGLGIDGQWSDDFHHAVHVALTGETDGYYADFEPLSALAKVCTRGFFHDGTWSSFRGRPHGAPVDLARMPAWRLVVCTQNHDQIGNRARGDRLTETLDEDQLGCAALLTLAGPFTPMLFQGEEWAASTPFCFFTTHPEPELGEAVRRGRLKEFEQMGWDPAAVPDPQDPDTLARSRLDWSELERGRHARVLALYRQLAELRRTRPELTDPRFGSVSCSVDEARRVFVMRRSGVLLALNLGEQEADVDLGVLGFADALPATPQVLVATASGARLEDGRVVLPPHAGALLGAP